MLGFITCPVRGEADRLIAALADRLLAEGRDVIGMVRADIAQRSDCEMHLRLLPEGNVHTISQDLGRGADACVLDAGALEQVVAQVARSLDDAPPGTIALFNKFGKQEASGRGCRDLIAQAIGADLAVIVSVPPETRTDFDRFSDGFAQQVAPNIDALAAFLGS
ncbi:DUF2478 domain-containing protein [Thioclava sp.]|uniref:DUF2478 domain-containing protein n=1 Tax=Thioclava sp. TaxID=1933450 RepID=UPI003AA7DCD8